MQTERSFYDILGVDRRATTDHIKAAYREIARIYHPDSNFYDEIIEDIIPTASMDVFKRITAAYNTLIHEEKRREYDRTLAPELSDWEDSELQKAQKESHQDWVNKKATSSGSHAMGTFGKVKEHPQSAFQNGAFTGAPRSVAEMMHHRRGWLWRVRNFLGLS